MSDADKDALGLQLEQLSVRYHGADVAALDRVSLTIERGRCLAVLGESGSGKSSLCRALLGLNDTATQTGAVHIGGTDVSAFNERDWRSVRWTDIALAFQSTTSLDPLMSVARQVAEPMQTHSAITARQAQDKAHGLLAEVGLSDTTFARLPHELSGGQRRLVLVAMALACDPSVVVFDEPTAGLDPLARAHLIDVLQRLHCDRDLTMLLVTHDVDLARRIADDAALLYRGWVAEWGPATQVLDAPRSPYSFGLLNAVPTLHTLKELRGLRPARRDADTDTASDGGGGGVPKGDGCPFLDRCAQVVARCSLDRPALAMVPEASSRHLVSCHRGGMVNVLEARGLVKSFTSRGRSHGDPVRAVDGVDLCVRAGEVLGIAGLNGAGKSTLVSMLASTLAPDHGDVLVDGISMADRDRDDHRRARRMVQLVQQDPYASISPRFTVLQVIEEPLVIARTGHDSTQRRDAVTSALNAVRLPTTTAFLQRRSAELSGGELQRLSIARALIVQPLVLVLDEPVSMLDPSEQAEVLQLIKNAQVHAGAAVVFVSHDFAVLLRIADRIAVLDAGRVIEHGSGSQIFRSPAAELTRRLLAAAGATTNGPPV